jgi:hypothetical protein
MSRRVLDLRATVAMVSEEFPGLSSYRRIFWEICRIFSLHSSRCSLSTAVPSHHWSLNRSCLLYEQAYTARRGFIPNAIKELAAEKFWNNRKSEEISARMISTIQKIDNNKSNRCSNSSNKQYKVVYTQKDNQEWKHEINTIHGIANAYVLVSCLRTAIYLFGDLE